MHGRRLQRRRWAPARTPSDLTSCSDAASTRRPPTPAVGCWHTSWSTWHSRPEPGGSGSLEVSERHHSSEREADNVSAAALSGARTLPAIHRTGPRVGRQGLWQQFKTAAYDAIIDGLRTAKRASIAALRALATRLPSQSQPAGNAIVDVVDAIADFLIGALLTLVGIIVGFSEGVVDLIMGLISLIRGILTGLYAVVADLLTGRTDRSAEWWNNLVTTVRAIPAGLRALFRRWIAEFEAASPERKVLMVGELEGQILALIASFYVAPSRAGSAGTLAEAGGVAASSGARAARPALRVIQGGGAGGAASGAGRAARVAAGTAGRTTGRASAFEGNAARQLAEVAEVAEAAPAVTPRPAPRLVPPQPAAAEPARAAARGRGAARAGAAAGAATAAATRASEEGQSGGTMMRHQIQMGTLYHYASTTVMAPSKTGVTALQLRNAMAANLARYMMIARDQETKPLTWTRGPVRWEPAIRSGIIRQSQWITDRVRQGGVTTAGNVGELQTGFNPETLNPTNDPSKADVRLDIENRGHNLRA